MSRITDEALLRLAQAARGEALSLETHDELRRDWERALRYYKGEMPEIAALEGRSQAVSSDIADAVESLLPDLLEIFTGGDDVAAFRPRGAEDEAAAAQETDYVNHVVMDQNPGFHTFYTAFKDALLCKIGVFKAWREEDRREAELKLTGKTAMELQLAQLDGWAVKTATPHPGGADGEGLFDAVLARTRTQSRIRVEPVAPEHFAFARDAVRIADAAYCCMKSYPRAQSLIAAGHDPALVARLPAWSGPAGEAVATARDTVREGAGAGAAGDGDPLLRQVEIVEHYLRLLDGDRLALVRVVTGDDEKVLLERGEAARIPFSVITPYMVSHRLMGRSVADLLLQVQEIRTVLTRMMLDSGYFAINQRHEIDQSQLTETTIDDYLDNRPNRPVISKNGAALRPIATSGLSFDAFAALEYTATLAEQRTGVVRNAQGLNPDTLHDTKGGAQMLVNAAQKRVRMIARIFAETGVRDLYLIVHALLREGPAQPAVARLRGRWTNVTPTAWGAREDMDIQVGVGAGGREHDLAVMHQVMGLQAQIVQGQGGPTGPMVGPRQIFAAAKRTLERAGLKGVEQFIADPASGAAGAAGPPPPPPGPNLEMLKLQQALQVKRMEIEAEAAAARYKADLDAQVRREQMAAELQLRREAMAVNAATGERAAAVKLGGVVG